MQGKALLEVCDLTVRFREGAGSVTVVDRLSFSLMESETLAVVGESGSGKTVTALAILKLITSPPGEIGSGSILFCGKGGEPVDLLQLDDQEMQKIRGRFVSMVFQEPMTSLNPVFTCGEQVSESLRLHLGMKKKEARGKVVELFREVLLPRPEEVFRAYPHELSGGQKQRVMIAMAIACNPAVLIADEPTTALDVTVQKTILELMKSLQVKRKMSIIFVTHDLGIVAGFADRVLVMNKGKIVESGFVDKVFRHPQHPYTRGLLACRPPMNSRPVRLPTVADTLTGSPHPDGVPPPRQGPPTPTGWITPEERRADHERIYSREPVLRVEGVSKTYGKFRALDTADLLVWPGETLGIVGESGSGKTTLARVVLELIPPTDGRIFYRQEEITRITRGQMKSLRKDLQIIFQDPYSSLNPRLTAGQAILEPMKVHKLHGNDKNRVEKVNELLHKVGLAPAHFHRYPHEFSGGQRQRICIARALAVEPKLVICDESVSALDVSIQAQVLNLLNDLKREFGLTYIFISHDLSVVRYMSDRLIVMRGGKIVEAGEADAVYANPKTEYTKMLLEAVPGGWGGK